MARIEDIVKEETNKYFDEIVAIRRYLHENPEIAREEKNTALKIESELDKYNIKHERVGEYGVVGHIYGKKKNGLKIALRADIDALPINETNDLPYKSKIENRMHACGHDSHTASLLGAARILNEHKDLFDGEVLLTFQQGEEIGYGARIIVDSGILNDTTRTFGVHASSSIDVGKISVTAGPQNASVDWFRITVHGHSAHITQPDKGVDAIYIASQIVNLSQGLITKNVSPIENALIGIGKLEAGVAYNVLAREAILEGTIRTFSSETRKKLKDKLEQLAKNVAENYGGSADIIYKDFTSPLVNDLEASKEAQEVAFDLFGRNNVITDLKPSLGGDDFAEYIIKTPGVYAYFGTANVNKPYTILPHHDDKFDIDEDGIKTAVEIYAAYTIRYLNGEFNK